MLLGEVPCGWHFSTAVVGAHDKAVEQYDWAAPGVTSLMPRKSLDWRGRAFLVFSKRPVSDPQARAWPGSSVGRSAA